MSFSNPFKGVDASPAFLAFCVYVFCIVSYRLPWGTASMSIALLTLPMEKKSLRAPAPVLLIFALVAWAFVGVLTTDYPDIVLDNVNEFAKVAAVAFVGINVLTSRARIRAFLVGLTIVFVAYPIRGTILTYMAGSTLGGRAMWNYTYSNPNDLAGLTILALSVALGVLVVEGRKWVRLGALIAVPAMVVVIVLTQSRGAFIALIAFLIIGGKKYVTNVRSVVMLIGVAILVFAVAPDSVWKRFNTISVAGSEDETLLDPESYDVTTRGDVGSSMQRLAIWHVASTIIIENPFTGVGLGAYPQVHAITARRPNGGFNPIARGRRDTHSTYLNLMAETGLVGFAFWAALVVAVIRVSRRARHAMQQRFPVLAYQQFNLEIGLYGYLVAAIWGSYAGFMATYVHLVVMYCCAKLLEEEGNPRPRPMRRGGLAAPIPAPAPAYAARTPTLT